MVVAGHWNFIIVRCLASTYVVMIVTIYKVENELQPFADSEDNYCDVFNNARAAKKFYNRQRKRLEHKDVDWQSVTFSRITFKGSPRQIACNAYDRNVHASETIEKYERTKNES